MISKDKNYAILIKDQKELNELKFLLESLFPEMIDFEIKSIIKLITNKHKKGSVWFYYNSKTSKHLQRFEWDYQSAISDPFNRYISMHYIVIKDFSKMLRKNKLKNL